jgi:hypothetical protein
VALFRQDHIPSFLQPLSGNNIKYLFILLNN